ncbi:MAG: ribonuclease N1 [Proteobacteria bacterium]|nr:ribonuclease N1 [Pseudomonadota bacterium]
MWRGLAAVVVAATMAIVAYGPRHQSQLAPFAQGTPARPTPQASDAPHEAVALAQLPPEAQRTARLIRAGGPFPYEKDATVFGNRERLLPVMPRGFYREYTVPTPGSRDRGARRIVCGGWQAREPDHCFYTDDHYVSYSRITW